MLGHGSPEGLFSVGQFETDNSYIIDSSLTDILAEKEENLYIWCYANQFVEKFDLKGFYTGMFVSEILEALYCELPLVAQKVVDESNDGFSSFVSKYVNDYKSVLYKNTVDKYQIIANRNLIAAYNIDRLYFVHFMLTIYKLPTKESHLPSKGTHFKIRSLWASLAIFLKKADANVTILKILFNL